VAEDQAIVSEWCTYEGSGDILQWSAITSLVDNFDKARRQGESSSGLLVPNFKYWTNRIDFFGIPSSLALIGLSLYLHDIIKPRWPKIVELSTVAKDAIWGVIEFRFYIPMRDIVLDLLNKRQRMLDPFAVQNEQTSLDNMLRDLGVGDGSALHRKEAIAAASRMYEEEVSRGPLMSLARGNIIRLLLIQIQQLKADMLLAMDSIDDLVASNRLNVQLLAGIPAFLIVTYGLKVVLRWMYFFRTQDIRPINGVHGEMTDYLDKIERSLLLANREDESSEKQSRGSDSGSQPNELSSQPLFLPTRDLGEIVVMIHSYLVLLDYCSPPFPSSACDSIHKSIQYLLVPGKLSIQRQLDLLRLVKSKHAALV
jgi:nuclear-control-of-ATPase protein 2